MATFNDDPPSSNSISPGLLISSYINPKCSFFLIRNRASWRINEKQPNQDNGNQ